MFKTGRRAFRRRAKSLCAGAPAAPSGQLPAARRAHQPPGPAGQGRAARIAAGVLRHAGLRLATTATSSTSWPRACSRWATARCRFIPAITRTTCGASRRRPASRTRRRCRPPEPEPEPQPELRTPNPSAQPHSPAPDGGTLRGIEEEVARLEAEIGQSERELAVFKSAEETRRLTEALGQPPLGAGIPPGRVGRALAGDGGGASG